MGNSLDQPDPINNEHRAVWPQVIEEIEERVKVQALVIADMKERDMLGLERYGTQLQPFNGRDVLKDAYAEALDLAVYLKQALLEKNGRVDLTHRTLRGRLLSTIDTIYILRALLLECDGK